METQNQRILELEETLWTKHPVQPSLLTFDFLFLNRYASEGLGEKDVTQ